MNKNQDLFRSYFTSIKLSLFEVSFKVLDNKGQSLLTTVLLSIIQFFQMIYFPFQIQLSFAWYNEIISLKIQKVLQYFTLIRLLLYQDIHVYLIGMYAAAGAVYFMAIALFFSSIFKFLQQWKIIIQILGLVLRFCMTVGFIEITRILLGFLICKSDGKGDYHMLYCPDQVCWEGMYIMHACVAIITIIVYFFITYIAIQLLVELRRNQTNYFSQKEGQSYSFIFVYAVLSLLLYSLLEHPQYSVISIIIQNLTSLSIFLKINYNRPFYNNIVQKMWTAISGLVFYTNFMLFISYSFEHIVFKNTLVCWIISSPMLLVILLRQESLELDLIKANMIQQLSSDEIIEKCQFLIDLVLHHEKDQKKEIYLTGYLEVHKQTCENPNCAIKVNKTLSRKFKGNPKYSEKSTILKELISQIFQNGIQKYPLSVKLKLHYCYYLFDFLEQGQKALTELEKAENLNPSFGEEFLIFKMKKTIENYFSKSSINSQNINQILNFDRSMKYQFDQLKQCFEELAFNKLIFWNLLLEEVPNVAFLFKYGNLILNLSKLIQTQLKQKFLNNNFDTKTEALVRKFSKYAFMIDIQEIVNFKKNYKAPNEQKEHQFIKDSIDLSLFSSPILVLEIFGKNNQQPLICNVNASFLSLIGYSKTDLLGKSAINIIQTSFYSLQCSFIESYFSLQLQEKLLEIPEKQTFLVHKSKYVIPTNVRSSIFPTEKGVFQFAQFRQDPPYHQIGFLLFSLDGKIDGITSSCISLLNIQANQFQFRQLFIQRLFPYLLQNKDKYLSRPSSIEYDYLNNSSLGRSSEFEDKHTDEYLKYNLIGQLFEITSKSYSIIIDEVKQSFFGYYLKLENNELCTTLSIQIQKRQKILKQFNYNIDKNAYIFECTSQLMQQNDLIDCESDFQEEPRAYVQTQQSFPSKKTFYKPKLQQLGSDIRTFRLFQGQINEVIQNEDDDEEMSQVEENNQKAEILKEEKLDLPINFTSSQDLRQFLMKIQLPEIFKRSIFIITILVISLLLIAGLLFFYSQQTLNQFQIGISLLTFNNQRLASLLKIQSTVQDLRGCNLKIEPYTMGTTGGRFPALNYIELNQELNILIETNLKLIEAQKQIKIHYELSTYDLEVQQVPMFTRDGNHKNFSYAEAIQQLIAKAITLNNTNITRFVDDNEDFHYYLHNTLNSIPSQQFISQYFYYYYIRDLLDDENLLQDIFFVLSSLNIALIVCFIYIYYYSHKKNIQQTISIFLGLSTQQVRMLINKIQAFIQLLQNNQDENGDSEQEEEIVNEKDFNDKINRFRKRKLTYQLEDSFRLQFKFWICILLIYSYFCYIYFSFNNIISTSYAIVPLVNLTSYIPTQYRLMDNSIKEMLYDENAILYNDLNSVDKLLKILGELKQLDATLHQYNQQNAAILSEQYINAFNSLYIQDPCEIIVANDLTVNITSCENFNKKILQEGLAVANTNFFENAQYMLIQYSLYNKSENYVDLKYNLSANHRNNYTFNLYNTRIGNANRKMQKVFIRICHIILVQELENNISNHFSNLSFQTTILFLIFCIFYIIGYFLFIIPMQVRFYMDNEKAKEILTLIPILYFNNDENLQALLREFMEYK